MFRYTCLLFLIFGIIRHSLAQSLHINEIVAANSRLQDTSGDTPDWFELYNSGSDSLFLQGIRVSDKDDFTTAWEFPAIFLPPQDHLLVFASGKDIKDVVGYQAIIKLGDDWRYYIPSTPIAGSWRNLGFDASNWDEGPTGMGYGDEDDATLIPPGTVTLYLRKEFDLTDITSITRLLLHVDYDDSFISYLNGQEIARANIGSAGVIPPHNATAHTDREAEIYRGGLPELFVLETPEDLLLEGKNVLSIEVHNVGSGSSDMSILPFLTLERTNYPSDNFPGYLNLANSLLHTDFKISRKGETLSLYTADGTLIDQLGFDSLGQNISIGRAPDGSDTLGYFPSPTPSAPNTGPQFDGIITNSLTFSHISGVYSQALQLTLSSVDPTEEIRYTTDGSAPTSQSELYQSPIAIDQTTVIRATLFRPGYLSPRASSHTYFINSSSDLPTISILSDPSNFWDQDSGIYVLGDDYVNELPYWGANFWQDWERPIHLSFIDEDGNLQYQSGAGVKIFGGWSRALDQRSLSIFARSRYGDEPFTYSFFPNRPYDEFEAMVLRNSGNDWLRTMIRDATLTGLLNDSHVDIQAYRPTRVFINGSYWGIHNLREKINEHFLATLHEVDPDSIDLLEFGGDIIHGDNSEYLALLTFIQTRNLEDDDNYQQVADQLDLDNYLQYQAAQIFFDNTDWPGNNIKFWKHPGGKWRWILFDTDFGFGIWASNSVFHNTLAFALDNNGPGWPNPPWSTLLFRKLCENESFRHRFINQYADELNTRFLSANIIARIDSLSATISNEMVKHMIRWDGDLNQWNGEITRLRDFATRRPVHAFAHIQSEFQLPSRHFIHLENPESEKGKIQLNSLLLQEKEWQGSYFESVPVNLIAIPEPGFQFERWSGDVNSTLAEITLDLTEEAFLTAHFTPGPIQAASPIVINEINYHSADTFDTGDWVELINPSQESIDIGGWVLKDGDDTHEFVFPNPTLLSPGELLIICRDLERFEQLLPDSKPIIGNVDFGFSSKGDAVRLFDPLGELIDEINYLPTLPWPEEADGTGATLSLRSPDLDNSLPENWWADPNAGTPGSLNIPDTTQTAPPPEDPIQEPGIFLYPNPTPDKLNLLVREYEFSTIRFLIYSSLGQKVFEREESYIIPNTEEFQLDLEGLNNGFYVLRIVTDLGTFDFPFIKSS